MTTIQYDQYLLPKMEESELSNELYTLSFDSREETNNNPTWYGIIQHFSHKGLENLRDIFKNNVIDNEEIGLTRDEFKEAISTIYGNFKYSDKSLLLFDDVAKEKNRISWNDFLDFLIENMDPRTDYPVHLYVGFIETAPHMSRETISKIVLIETEKYFCYAAVSKHGRIGIYDGNLNFLTSYHVIMTREDLERNDDERRRKNRWVTDAIFCLDIQMFVVTNSTRSIAIYEASGLKHEPYWLIIGIHEVIDCLAYKSIFKNKDKSECILFGGTNTGDILLFKFLQPENLLLRRKYTDKISIFYWPELRHEQSYLKIKFYKNVHCLNIEQMDYIKQQDAVISCSKDPEASLVKKFMSIGKLPAILKLRKGCNCFTINNALKILVTGSSDNIIRIWNSVLISNIIAILKGHNEKIIDVVVMETQHMVLSFSSDGILKMWEINENKCLQTVKIEYPAYSTLGKLTEYGRKNIYPGPKRSTKALASKDENSLYQKYFGISEVEERAIHVGNNNCGSSCMWERSHVLVTCCNYIATLRITYEDVNIEKSNEMAILRPPPLQNTVLIPAAWQIPSESLKKDRKEDLLDENVKDSIKKMDFIINKDLFDIEGSKSDINYKIAILEAKKIKMKTHVAKGAPYLALYVSEIEELKLSDELRIPNKTVSNVVENINKMLDDALMRDQAFSRPASRESLRSSRLSIV